MVVRCTGVESTENGVGDTERVNPLIEKLKTIGHFASSLAKYVTLVPSSVFGEAIENEGNALGALPSKQAIFHVYLQDYRLEHWFVWDSHKAGSIISGERTLDL
jgi:hypothetical protein